MKGDLSLKIHQGIYGRDKSDRPNAAQNSGPDFQAGYRVGLAFDGVAEFCSDQHPISLEWRRRGSPLIQDESFKEWKRGYNAARMQRAVAKAMGEAK